MNTVAIALVGGALFAVLTAWAVYLASIPRGAVPARPVGAIALQLVGIGLAIAGIAWSVRAGGWGQYVQVPLAVFAVSLGGMFLFLLTQRKTPVGQLAVAVGDGLLPFDVRDSDGEPFHTDALAGDRVLLKFFRGGW